MSGIALSIAWLTPQNFAAHKCLDPAGLPATFDHWLSDAEVGVKQLALAGHVPERIIIDPRELAAWCKAEGKSVDGAARAAFVAHLHGRMHSYSKAALRSASSSLPLTRGSTRDLD